MNLIYVNDCVNHECDPLGDIVHLTAVNIQTSNLLSFRVLTTF